MYTTRDTCRLCGGNFEDVVSLGEIYLSTFLGTEEDAPPKAPLDLVRCVECNLYQLRHTVDQNAMYQKYWYQSGLNNSMKVALQDVVTKATQQVSLKTGDIVLDIGANDGTLLSYYSADVVKIACEPSNVGSMITSADIVIRDYFTADNYFKRCALKAKIITAIAMFYDLEDPHSFIDDLKKVLADDGVLIIQMMDLMSMVQTGDFPNLCHEHLEYYSLDVLDYLLLQHGLEVYDVEYNNVNGGSLRVYVRHLAEDFSPSTPSVLKATQNEYDYFKSLDDVGTYFRERVQKTKYKLQAFIAGATTIGWKVAVLGASTKGNTMLQYFELTNKEIDHAAEVNPDKFGKRTVGSNIPIISEEESLRRKPDYYLVLPWGFTDFFVKRFDEYLTAGGALIVPLPAPRVIYKSVTGQLKEDYL